MGPASQSRFALSLEKKECATGSALPTGNILERSLEVYRHLARLRSLKDGHNQVYQEERRRLSIVRRARVDSRVLKTRRCAGLYSSLIGVVDSLWDRVVSEMFNGERDRNEEYALDGAMPACPSAFLACHHFPELSITSSISFLANEISFGSSGEAVSK